MDLSNLGPTVGVGALFLYMLRFMWQEVGDRRRHEQHLREDFAKERAELREECAKDRSEDRSRIAALEAELARLRGLFEGDRR